MGRYEDCAYKAEDMTLSKKYENDPEPYLYLTLCYIAFTKSPELQKNYPDAVKEAIKNAITAKKKDKSGEYYANNKDIFDEVWSVGVKEARKLRGENQTRKALTLIKQLIKLFPIDPSLFIFEAVCEIELKASADASKTLDSFWKNLTKEATTEMSKEQQSLLQEYFQNYLSLLESQNLKDSLNKVKDKVKGIELLEKIEP